MDRKRFSFVLLCAALCALMCLPCLCPAFAAAADAPEFEALSYPDEALTDFREEMTDRVSSDADYFANRGFPEETGLYRSPYWRCAAADRTVPVYAAMSYDYVLDKGVLQSFAYLFVKRFGAGLPLTLTFSAPVKDAVVLPRSLGTDCAVNGDTVSLTVAACGCYTVLVNGDSQQTAFTLFVREWEDEDAAVAAYFAEYGEENVVVCPKGVYELETVDTSASVYYCCRGSYIAARHVYDLRSDEERDAMPPRSSFLGFYNRDNIIMDGFGTFDFTKTDRMENRPFEMSGCRDCSVSGMLFLDPGTWTVTLHNCKNVELGDIAVIGYRTNSDAINVCCSEDVTVRDCFARNGDDCYSVKTTVAGLPAARIRFENCVAWSNKARCFGITGEAEAPISDVTFADSAVICRNATWDNDRVSSLAVAVETGGAAIDSVTFENIEIREDAGRPVNVLVYDNGLKNCSVKGVVFRNIDCARGGEPSRIAAKRTLSFVEKLRCFFYRFFSMILGGKAGERYAKLVPNGNKIEATFENVTVNGEKLTRANAGKYVKTSGCERVSYR
ncbi:MAG: hypothetical protein IJL26_06835 [Clostridia bacterium]|nr:hypothetical protein [Clostridia bacterium]